MKAVLPLALLLAGAGMTQAAIIQQISFNLSQIHVGSTLSGNFTLSDSPAPGDTAPVTLNFSDPADYMPTSLTSTITLLSGTPSGTAVDFSPIMFTNLSGVATPINTRDLTLMRSVFAVCTSFPCTTSGMWQDRTPPVFTGAYTISPVAAAAVPEPGSGLPLAIVLLALV